MFVVVRWNLSLSLWGEVVFASSRFTKLLDQVIIVVLLQIELFNTCYIMSSFFIPQMVIGSLERVRPCRGCLGYISKQNTPIFLVAFASPWGRKSTSDRNTK